MRYLSAYMLAAMSSKHSSTKHHITAYDIENILGSVGVDCDSKKAEEIVSRMQGKTLEELIALGSNYLCSASGGGAPVAAAAVAADARGDNTAAPDAEKKEDKKEKEEESDEDLGFGLFD